MLNILNLIFCNVSQKASVTVLKTTHRVVLLTAFESRYYILLIKRKDTTRVSFVLWRRERDSNPRVLAHKLISSQPRYDHFDISPHMIKLKTSLIFKIHLAGRPVMSCCGTQNLLLAFARQILTAATPYCSLYLPPVALANVPTSIYLHIKFNFYHENHNV